MMGLVVEQIDRALSDLEDAVEMLENVSEDWIAHVNAERLVQVTRRLEAFMIKMIGRVC